MNNLILAGPAGTAVLQFCFIILLSMASGLAVTLRLRGAYFIGERLLLGMTLGVIFTQMLIYVLSVLLGVHSAVLWSVLIVTALIAVISFRSNKSRFFPSNWQHIPPLFKTPGRCSKVDFYGLGVFLGTMLFFWIFIDRLVMWQDGALATGIIDNWGDLPFHLGVITTFLNGSELPPMNQTFAGHPLTYPFLSDFFSAMLILAGMSLEHAIELPAALFISVTLTLLYYLGYRLVRQKQAAALATALFVLAGGLGFLWFLSDIYLANSPIWDLLKNLPRRYTNISELEIHWVNPTLAHLLPQRSFLFGFPLALSIILLWWQHKDRKKGNAWLPGIFAGLLPLSHTHTFLAMMLVSGMMAILTLIKTNDRRNVLRYWLTFYGVAFVIAAPQLYYLLASKLSVGGIIRFETGWMAGDENLVWFWLKNTGLLLPLLLCAILFSKRLGIRKRALHFYLPFGLLFVICNLLLFSPLPYDTNKILVFAFLLAMPFVATVPVALFKSKSWWLHGFAFRLLLLTLVFSGSLNLLNELQNDGWQELSAEEVELAVHVRKATANDAVFLTAPVHNNFLTLAGRQIVLGYPGHVYSHGLDQAPVEQAVSAIFSGHESAAQKLQAYNIDYIVVGPHERSKYGEAVEWLQKRFLKFMHSENYIIYKVENSTADAPSIP